MTFEAPDIGDRVPAAEAVVAQALAAFRAQDWEGVVALTDADSSEKLRRNYLRGKARRTQRSPPSWVGPDAVSEEIRELLKAMAELPVTFHELAAVTTLEEAEALSVTEFMVRWAQARHAGYVAAQGLREGEGHMVDRAVIGSVAILPDTVAVLVRDLNASSSQPLATIGLIAVLGDGRGVWRLDAASAWLGMADAILR